MNYTRKTDTEVKQLALDLYGGLVFTDRQCQRAEDLQLVFMPLALMKADQLQEFIDCIGEGGLIYEYLHRAGRMQVNGYPSFMSAQFLDTEDTERVSDMIESIKQAVDAL